ncbi:MAG: acyl CoA--acetate/3-ketoacid CoA transferase subunit beta [candidate division NC10 bacterium]|nr:acyl CoA--acetate/3-ketoacid CoA transferase subunit beta [candidate division NC10 bacterium]
MGTVAEFTDTEFMICSAARILEDKKTVFVGWGMPQVVAILAEKLYTPNLVQIFEFGALGPQSLTPFVRGTMGGPSNVFRSLQWTNMNWAFSYAVTGHIDYGMIGALQVDQYGNINSTLLGGNYARPKRRFPGSGGGNEVASLCWKTLIILKHEPRRFVLEVDFLTSPGYLDGPGAREKAGLPRGTGPYRVVTSKALFGFDEETKQMKLVGVLKGLKPEQVIQGMGFTPLVAEKLVELEPPTADEIRMLREEIDPSGIIIRGEKMRVPR